MIIEMRALWLIKNYVRWLISCYNHLARGDYYTEALVFKMAGRDFLIIVKKKSIKLQKKKLLW